MLYRMKPWRHEHDDQEVVWGGWAKMALPIAGSRIVQVGKPLVGEVCLLLVKIIKESMLIK